MDAHLAAFANTTLNFNAFATAETVNQLSGWSYGYELAFLYRIGLSAVAQVYLYGDWRTKTYYPVDWQKIKLWGDVVKSSPASSGKRSLGLSEEPLPDAIFHFGQPVIAETSAMFIDSYTIDSNLTEPTSLVSRQAGKDRGPTQFEKGNGFKCTTQPGGSCGSPSLEENPGDGPPRRDLSLYTGSMSSSLKRRAALAPRRDCPRVLPRLFCEPKGFHGVSVLTRFLDSCTSLFADYAFTAPAASGGTGNAATMPGELSCFVGSNPSDHK